MRVAYAWQQYARKRQQTEAAEVVISEQCKPSRRDQAKKIVYPAPFSMLPTKREAKPSKRKKYKQAGEEVNLGWLTQR